MGVVYCLLKCSKNWDRHPSVVVSVHLNAPFVPLISKVDSSVAPCSSDLVTSCQDLPVALRVSWVFINRLIDYYLRNGCMAFHCSNRTFSFTRARIFGFGFSLGVGINLRAGVFVAAFFPHLPFPPSFIFSA